MTERTAARLRRWRPTWRSARWAIGLGLLLVLVAHPLAHAASDVFQNVGPASQLQGGALADRYSLGNYALDHHFSAVSASLLGGVDVSGVPALIAYFLADVIWQLTAFLANALITLFTFAFSLDLVNGSQATGGAGALAPVSSAVRSIYASTFGAPWLVVGIVLAGLWAMWKALVQRRYVETAGALGLSVIFVVIALAFVTQPEQTICRASRWSNDMSAAFLSLSSNGSVGNEQQAKQQASDQLFHLLVYQPWVVLNFGGLEHCVKTPVNGSSPQSVAVRPLSADPARDAALSSQLSSGTQVQADGKLCINNENKYAGHFLLYAPESDQRNAEYDALSNADASKLPSSDPGRGSYQLSAADKPAADAMGKGGQYERLLLAIVIFAGELGAFLLLGSLSVAVILAQVLVLLLLAFAPVALVIGVYPGRGHDFFRGWLSRLATFLLRKAIYSLILAVLLAVAAAVGDATSNLGWLLAFGLQGAFFWAVFLYRHQLTGQLTAATTGTAARAEDGTLRLASIYAATRFARRALPGRRGATRTHKPAVDPAPPDSITGEDHPSSRPESAETGGGGAHDREDLPATEAASGVTAMGPPAARADEPAGSVPAQSAPLSTPGVERPVRSPASEASPANAGPATPLAATPTRASGSPQRPRPATDPLPVPPGSDRGPEPAETAEPGGGPPSHERGHIAAPDSPASVPAPAEGSPRDGSLPLSEQLRRDAQRLTRERGQRDRASALPERAEAPERDRRADEPPPPTPPMSWPARPQRPGRPEGEK